MQDIAGDKIKVFLNGKLHGSCFNVLTGM